MERFPSSYLPLDLCTRRMERTTSPLEEVPSYAAMAAEITATSSASPIRSSPAAGTGAAALTGAGATGAGAGAAFSFWPVSHLWMNLKQAISRLMNIRTANTVPIPITAYTVAVSISCPGRGWMIPLPGIFCLKYPLGAAGKGNPAEQTGRMVVNGKIR